MEISLDFPITATVDKLENAVPDDFYKSQLKKELETTLGKVFIGGMDGDASGFTIQGVDAVGGVISIPTEEEEEEGEDTPGLRGSEDGSSASRPPHQAATTTHTQVTYTLTARGTYRPPPYEQLGTVLQESINSDPEAVVKSLKDRESNDLPAIFDEVETASARHMTLKVGGSGVKDIQDVVTESAAADGSEGNNSDGMVDWAKVPIVLLSLLIAGLFGILLFRRAFVRRTKKKIAVGDDVISYLNEGTVVDIGSSCTVGTSRTNGSSRTSRDYSTGRMGSSSTRSLHGSSSSSGLRGSFAQHLGSRGGSGRPRASFNSAPSRLEEDAYSSEGKVGGRVERGRNGSSRKASSGLRGSFTKSSGSRGGGRRRASFDSSAPSLLPDGSYSNEGKGGRGGEHRDSSSSGKKRKKRRRLSDGKKSQKSHGLT